MSTVDAASPALAPDGDAPVGEGLALAQFAAGCFWSVELVYQRLPGVARTEVGYSQGHRHAPTYRDVCGGGTGHAEVVRVHYDPNACPYDVLLDVFWAKHNPTTLNRQVRAPFLKTHTHTHARSLAPPPAQPIDPVAGVAGLVGGPLQARFNGPGHSVLFRGIGYAKLRLSGRLNTISAPLLHHVASIPNR
jgi:peptide-methionine (S)-S-oxide reductase